MLLILILLPLIFALICHVTARRSEAACWYVALLGTALELAAAILASLQPDHSLVPGLALLGPELCLALDGFRRVYILVIAFLWLMTTLFSGEYMAHYKNRGRYYSFQLLTLGLMMGEFLSQSLAQGFVFLCLMTASCSVWMRHEQTPEAHLGGRFCAHHLDRLRRGPGRPDPAVHPAWYHVAFRAAQGSCRL